MVVIVPQSAPIVSVADASVNLYFSTVLKIFFLQYLLCLVMNWLTISWLPSPYIVIPCLVVECHGLSHH